ncbi:Restriction alleviation protein Lar [uncultured Caudovirales phage]|uniref:Restriction alleviation protein Lar n=1 Tax=uncultured Caudovirales phage TaxID=2100421 RepID=A0A6J5KUG1_9CAUD|nr:Restriction alleviation protein Lar [uncultured Caudovirales phage]CAB4126178.1 Restriction alleviation protein Lar [uncultured Caudovirales phage]
MTDLIKRDDALEPCPFCGGKKNIICCTDYDGRDAYAVSCRYHNCHGSIFMLGYGYFATKAEAIAAWNTRTLTAIDPAAIREAALVSAVAKQIGEEHGWVRREELEAAEAKLAKAVEALREISKGPMFGMDIIAWVNGVMKQTRTVLAELEGK